MDFETLDNPHLKKIADEVLVDNEYKLSDEATKKNFKVRNIVDVGANCGAFSKRCIRDYPEANIIAVEPSPELWSVLEHNLQKGRVRICKAALIIKKQRTAFLYIGKQSAAQNSLLRNILTKSQTIKVNTITIPNFTKQYRIKNIDIFKIDIEGMELPILRKIVSRDRYLPKIIFVEFHSAADRLALDRLLIGRGYVLIHGKIKFPNRGNLSYVLSKILKKKFCHDYAITDNSANVRQNGYAK